MTVGTTPQVDRYRIVEVIGTGAFATVYRAHDERLSDVVAVKVLADNHCLDPDIRERFLSEGRALRRVRNQHVVRIHDLGETDRGQPFLVLEYADRGTLAERVEELRARGWHPTVGDLSVVAHSLAAAVEGLHERDLVHRDLSPGNILLRSTAETDGGAGSELLAADEQLVLSDLGFCKDLAINSGLTVAGGTDGFRPPEQRAGPSRVDRRADIWALSAVMAWLASGRSGDGRSSANLPRKAGLPHQLGAELARGLSENPERRHRDVAAWLNDIEAALSEPEPTRDTTSEVASKKLALRWRGLARGSVALLIGAILGAVAALNIDLVGGEVVDLPDGRVEVSRRDGAMRVAIIGPSEVGVGQVASFSADTTGVRSWVWVMPDGVSISGEAQVQLRARSPGTVRISLIGVSSGGERLEVEHRLEVLDS